VGAGDDYLLIGGKDRGIDLFNIENKEFICSFGSGHVYEVTEVAVKRDTTQFVSCGGDKVAFLWDVESRRIIRKLFGHEQRINSVCWNSPFENVVCTGSNDGSVRIHDLRSKDPVQILSFKDNVSCVRSQGDRITVSSMDGNVGMYSVGSGKTLTLHSTRPSTYVDISDDNHMLVSYVSEGLLCLFNSEAELLKSYRGHMNKENRLPCRLLDHSVLSSSEDGRLFIWDLFSGEIIKTVAFPELSSFAVCGRNLEKVALCSHNGSIEIVQRAQFKN